MRLKGYFAIITFATICTLSLYSCKRRPAANWDWAKPKRSLTEYFDKKYLLYKLPEDYYKNEKLNQSFEGEMLRPVQFRPLGYETSLNLQYTHVYSSQCVYHTADTIWKYAEVCFPNTCLTKDMAYAQAVLSNMSDKPKTYYLRLFYQNTSYWYRTDDSIDLNREDYLDNYYGASRVVEAKVGAGKTDTVKIPYIIGLSAKGDFDFEPSKDPARPGNYEFMLLSMPNKDEALMDEKLNLQKTNPFAMVKKDQLQNKGNKYYNYSTYVEPKHFKFVFLDEYFDNTNDLDPDHVYIVKDGKEKRLCDTCSGWYKGVISEFWNNKDFTTGFIAKADYVKADYGIKKRNCVIDTNGITINIPGSKPGCFQKTWEEFLFGPSFKYGHLTVRAKFAQMMNKNGTPNGIIHNLWLYQRDPDPVDTSNPYNYMRNGLGKQPYEIDFEIWNGQEGINSVWDEYAFINYSIVDYMRDPNVTLKPGEKKQFGKYMANRLNQRQCNIAGDNIPKEYYDGYHTYELYWYPDHLRFLLDGAEKAIITKDMAKIPDKYLFLWIGSPMYQDGIYYSQSEIPFLKTDKQTVVDYIRIE